MVYLGMPYTEHLSSKIIENIALAPYLIFFGIAVLGSFFKRYRIAILSFGLLLSYFILHSAVTNNEIPPSETLTFALIAFLLPLNIAVLAAMKEQQVLSMQGFGALTAIIVQFMLSYWLTQNYSETLSAFLFFKWGALDTYFTTVLSAPLIVAYFISFIALCGQVIKSKGLFEMAFLGCLISSFLYFNTGLIKPTDAFYIILAGLLLLWGLMQNSYLIAYFDELTELPGRRAMNEELARLRGLYTIAMLDIDFFKRFNDTYGHDVGDQVLRMVAGKINQIEGGGKAFRYGGEEFAIIFAGKDSKAAFPFLSNLRETIDNTNLILRSDNRPEKKPEVAQPRKVPWQQVHVTISIGVANSNKELLTIGKVIKAADEALYRSKDKGRNRISQYATMDYEPSLPEGDKLA